VPTWCPFRLQFYCNGHSWLARKLTSEGIDFARAQQLADVFRPDDLHRLLDAYGQRVLPGDRHLCSEVTIGVLMQTEYSTDLVFRSEATLKPLYEQLSRKRDRRESPKPYPVSSAKK